MRLSLVICLTLLSLTARSYAQDADATNGAAESSQNETSGEAAKPAVEEEEVDLTYMEADPKKWGSYYDPQQAFCGNYDCYQILGFDYETFGSPDPKLITKKYRKLSRKWHPDKSKHPDAKKRFVKISRAYEVLTNKEKRKEYDAMRYDQEAYMRKYGSGVIWSFAPKTDATLIVIVLFGLMNLFSWYAQKNKWDNVANRLVKAAAEEWSPSQGGSPESKALREHALEILAEREEKSSESEQSNGTAAKKSKAKKLSGKEKKKQETEALLPILRELVDEMHDFGGGFHKPTWRDLMVVNLAKFPIKVAVGTAWEIKYYARRFSGKELNDEEKEVLTERAVGPVAWDIASEESRDAMIKRELWIRDNLLEWKEEEEIKNLSSSEQKAIRKAQKAEKKKKV